MRLGPSVQEIPCLPISTKIQDVDSEILFARQLGLLMMDSLQSSDIQALIIKDLNKNDIKGYINTGIIVSKHFTKRNMESTIK